MCTKTGKLEVPTRVQNRRGYNGENSFLVFQVFGQPQKHYFLVSPEMLQIATHSFFARSRGRRGWRRLLFSSLTRKTTSQHTNQAPKAADASSVGSFPRHGMHQSSPENGRRLKRWLISRHPTNQLVCFCLIWISNMSHCALGTS